MGRAVLIRDLAWVDSSDFHQEKAEAWLGDAAVGFCLSELGSPLGCLAVGEERVLQPSTVCARELAHCCSYSHLPVLS